MFRTIKSLVMRSMRRKNEVQQQSQQTMQVYFCDMCGQTHALFARKKTEEMGKVYRIASISEDRTPYVTFVGQGQALENSSQFHFVDEVGNPVDIRQRNTQKGLFFFQMTAAV